MRDGSRVGIVVFEAVNQPAIDQSSIRRRRRGAPSEDRRRPPGGDPLAVAPEWLSNLRAHSREADSDRIEEMQACLLLNRTRKALVREAVEAANEAPRKRNFAHATCP